MADYRALSRAAATAAGIDADLFERQIGQECGWALDVIECRRDSSAGARGIAQLMPVHWSAVDPCDPEAALTYAARLMKGHLDYWGAEWALALSSYNAGRQRTIDGLAGKVTGWPFAETVGYVSKILDLSADEARRRLTRRAGGAAPMKLSEIVARARSRIGDPYVWGGKAPPTTDCSGFVAWAYGGQVPSFTDAILGATQRVETPAPGDIVLWEYVDPDQPGVRFPHTGLFLSDAETLDNRYGLGVGVHPQLPRARAARYYRRLPGVVVDTVTTPAEPPPVILPPAGPLPDKRDETIAGLRVAVAHLADVVVPKAAAAVAQRDEALAEAKRIREQFVGPKA